VTEKKINRQRVGLAGESMGAAIALQVAAANPWIRGVWADSPFASLRRVAQEYVRRVSHLPAVVLSPVMWTTIRVANYRGKFDVETVNPLALAASIKCSVFMVHGTADELISAAHSEIIHASLGGEKQIWFVEGAGHARAVRRAKLEYCIHITRFFAASLSDLADQSVG